MAKIYRDINVPIELEVLKENAQLGNVPNVTTNNQTPTWSMSSVLSNIISGETLTVIMGKISKAINDIISHIGNKSNPHSVTKSQIGLGNVENKSGATIRGEMTKSEVVDALGYTPPTSDTNTTYTLTKSGSTITLTGSDGSKTNVSDSNTTYTLSSFGITATASELNKLDGCTATVAELNYLDGVTSGIQTQLNGKLSISGTAAKATADASGQNIADTYIKGLSVNGRTITYTKGDGGTGTITTQDTNTTYDVATSSTLGLVKSGTDITVDSNGNVNVVGGDVNTAQTLKTARTINGVSFNGSENITITANPKENQLTNQNLNDIRTSGEYYAGGSNSVTNKPSGIDAFSLQVVRSAGGYYTQILIGSNNSPNKMFIRTYQSGTWTSWYPFYSSEYPQTSVSGNAGTATKLQTARKIAGVSFDGTKDITISYNNLTDKPTIPSGVQVIDNLTSSSTTASLSANQGRVLKSYLDKKIVVSSTQPSGQQTGDTWYQII